MSRAPKSILIVQILCGAIMAAEVGWVWLASESLAWDVSSPGGPDSTCGWYGFAAVLLLLATNQWLSWATFHNLAQTGRLGEFIQRHQALVAPILISIVFVAGSCWIDTAQLRGRIVARADSLSGHIRILGVGLPTPERPEFARLLRDRYGIEFRAVAGCMVSKPLFDYVVAYNQESTKAAWRKWGRDVVRECSIAAEKSERARRARD